MLMNHNRAELLDNMLISLKHQEVKPLETIVVNTGHWPGLHYHKMRLTVQHCPMSFNMPLAFNIGIKQAKGKYVMVTGTDYLFSPNLIATIVRELQTGNIFILAKSGRLPKGADISQPWPELCKLASRRGRKSVGAIQAAERDWFCKVRGYDERFAGGLGGVDDDIKQRAKRDGLRLHWIEFEEAQVLHQWHPKSKLKGKTSHLFRLRPEVVTNADKEWGQWTKS